MLRAHANCCSGLITICIAVGAAENLCAQEPDPRLAKIVADWEKRQRAYTSVRYIIKGQRTTTPSQPIGVRPKVGPIKQGSIVPGDVVLPKEASLLLDFAHNRHRLEAKEHVLDSKLKVPMPRSRVDVFDGTTRKTLIPRTENVDALHPWPAGSPDIVEQKGGLSNFTPDYWAILMAHGLIPTNTRPIVPGMLDIKPEKDQFHFHGEGTIDQQKMVILRTQPVKESGKDFYEYWVDEKAASGIQRLVTYQDNRPAIDIEISYEKKGREWLPSQWTWTFRDGAGKVLEINRMSVEAFIANPKTPADLFRFETKPGMIIHKVEFAVPAGKPG